MTRGSRRRSRCLAALGVGALPLACAASTPLPPTGPHPPHIQEFVPVAYPPPPAQVEEIPSRVKNPACVWVDGHYSWEGRRWEWQSGRWIVPAPGCYYAPPVVAWSKAGDARLYYTPPRWYKSGAAELSEANAGCAEPPSCKL